MASDPIPLELCLTYAELGDRLGIRPAGARAWAKRRVAAGRARIVEPNGQGPSRVYIDATELGDRSGDRSPLRPSDLAAELAEMRVAVARAEGERDVARAEAERDVMRVTAERDVMRIRAEAAEAMMVELRSRIEELQSRRRTWWQWYRK